MKPIEVKNQVYLGLGKIFSLTISGMYYRLVRSTITMSIVALAVAFLVYMFTYGVLVQDRTASAFTEFEKSRLLGKWLNRLSQPDPVPVIVNNLHLGNQDRIKEYRTWAPVSDSEFTLIIQSAHKCGEFINYFEKMREQARAVLLGETDPYLLPLKLQNQDYFDRFNKQIVELTLKPPLGDTESLKQFITVAYPLMMSYASRVKDSQLYKIELMNQELGELNFVDAFMTVPDSAHNVVVHAGYAMPAEDVSQLSKQAQLYQDEKFVNNILLSNSIRASVSRKLDIDPKNINIDQLTKWVASEKHAREFQAMLLVEYPNAPSAERLNGMAQNYQRIAKLQQTIGTEEPTDKKGFAAMPQATRWLILVSFIVCAVGVCNTMFMSVTERFTEIATMKCLGAMDSFIMFMFVMESIIQGIAGSLIGIVLGIALAFFRGVIGYGGLIFETIPWEAIFLVVGLSCLVGIILSAVAAVGPAWMAARLAPMEAMRVE